MIPATKPVCPVKPTIDAAGLTTGFTAACQVPECGWRTAGEVEALVRHQVMTHKREHRTELTSGGGSQTTIFDVLGAATR